MCWLLEDDIFKSLGFTVLPKGFLFEILPFLFVRSYFYPKLTSLILDVPSSFF